AGARRRAVLSRLPRGARAGGDSRCQRVRGRALVCEQSAKRADGVRRSGDCVAAGGGGERGAAGVLGAGVAGGVGGVAGAGEEVGEEGAAAGGAVGASDREAAGRRDGARSLRSTVGGFFAAV